MLEGGVWNQQLCGLLLKYRSGAIQANNCEVSFWHDHLASITSKQESIKFQHDTFVKKFILHQLIRFMLRAWNLLNVSFSKKYIFISSIMRTVNIPKTIKIFHAQTISLLNIHAAI